MFYFTRDRSFNDDRVPDVADIARKYQRGRFVADLTASQPTVARANSASYPRLAGNG